MLYLTYHLYLYLTVYIKSRNVHGWVEDPWNFAWIRTRVLFLYDSGSGCYTSSTWSSLLICQKLGNLEKQQIFVKINHFSLFYSYWTKSWQEISVYFLFNHKKIYYKKNLVSFRIHVLYTVWIRINENTVEDQEIADRENNRSGN